MPPHPGDRRGAPELEQVLDAVALAILHDIVHAEDDVAPGEPEPEGGWKGAEEMPEHSHRMHARGLVAGVHYDSKDEPQLRNAHRVVAVGRPPGLVRIVAGDGALLAPVERLHRRVEVEDVGLVEKRRQVADVRTPRPFQGRARIILGHFPDGAPGRVAGNELLHPVYRGQDGIVVEDVEVPVPGMPLQDAAEKRGEHAADRGRVVAGVAERAAFHKLVEGSAGLHKMTEEGVVAARCHQRRIVPPALEDPAGGVDPQGIMRRFENFRSGIIFHVGFHAVSLVFSLW